MRVVQWMHDSGRTKSLHDAATQTTANARMRDSACTEFRTMRNQQSKHDSTPPPRYISLSQTGIVLLFWCWGANSHCAGKARMPYKMNAQRLCRTQSPQSVHKRARMHDSGRTKSLHDAATQTTAFRHPATLPLSQTGISLFFGADVLVGERTRNLRVVQGCTIVLAPSFARCETNRASTIRHPAPPHFRPLASGVLFLVRWVREPALCG